MTIRNLWRVLVWTWRTLFYRQWVLVCAKIRPKSTKLVSILLKTALTLLSGISSAGCVAHWAKKDFLVVYRSVVFNKLLLTVWLIYMIQRKIHTKLAHIISLLLFILSIKFNLSVEDKCKSQLSLNNKYIFHFISWGWLKTYCYGLNFYGSNFFFFERDLQITQLFPKPKFKFHFRDPDGYFKLNIWTEKFGGLP